MNRELMRKLVCKYVYKSKYDPDTFRNIDWDKMLYKYEHEPGGKTIKLLNENKVNFVRQELVLLEEELKTIKEMMLQLETKHEKWMIEHDEVFRYRDSRSIEGKHMLEGPENVSIEEWFGYFYNSMMQYKAYMEKELGKAVKGDIGEENVARILEQSEYAEYTVHNIILDVADEGGNTNEIDTFVILPHGVAVLEVKNYGGKGQTLVVTDEDKWNLHGPGRRNKQEKNPAYQNSRHVRATILTLRKLLGRDIPIFPLIVIGNNQVELEKHSNLIVKNTDDFVSYLSSLRSNETLSDEERMQIKKFLEKEDIGANAFAVISYREQINHMKEIVKEIFIAASFNHVGKILYYKIQDIFSCVFIGLLGILIVTGAFVLHNLDSFIVFLIKVCLFVVIGAAVFNIGNEIAKKLKSMVSGGK